MDTYEQTRARHVAEWGNALADRRERLRWPREQLELERDRALRSLVGHARSASPWHAARLADIDARTLRASDLATLPTMTKQDVVEGFDEIVTDRRVTRAAAEAHLAGLSGDDYFCGDLHVVASGGSTGERAIFVYGWNAWVDVHLGFGRFVVSLFEAPDIGSPPLTLAMVAARSATHMTAAVAQTFRSAMVDTHLFPVTLPVAEIVAGLNALQPTVLVAYASMLGVLTGKPSTAPRVGSYDYYGPVKV